MVGRGEVWAGAEAGEAPLLYLIGISQVLPVPWTCLFLPCLSLPGSSQSLELLWQLRGTHFLSDVCGTEAGLELEFAGKRPPLLSQFLSCLTQFPWAILQGLCCRVDSASLQVAG